MSEPAQLIIVGTPIGNLGDWSPRAQEVIRSAGLVACEDTRRTGSLLAKHGIENPGMVVVNEHTEGDAVRRIIDTLAGGTDVVLVSDAGMPTISDPGAHAVGQIVDAGFEAVVVPGPTAVSAALALSGFTAGRWVFEGFLPRKGGERQRRLAELSGERRMIVLYEAPHRIARTLGDLAGVLDPDRRCVVARELTKLHETVWRGSLAESVAGIGEPRGEYVIVVDADETVVEITDEQLRRELDEALARGLRTKEAAAEVAARHGIGRRRVYELGTQA